MKKFFYVFIVVLFAIAACKKERLVQTNSTSGNGNGNNNGVNKPPIADAGSDLRPRDSIFLDGSASNDPDGQITSYHWRKISGSGNVVFSAADQKRTNVKTDYMGFFQFELEVTDNGGLSDKDSINVFFFLPGYLCDTLLRPVIDSRMSRFWRFPFQRFGMGVTTLGTKVYFAGGRIEGTGEPTANVAILDMETKTESQSNLSIPRAFIGCVSSGAKLFFAGGWTWAGALSRVEIVNPGAGTSSVAELSEPRWSVTTAVLGTKVFFAGGFYWNGSTQTSSRIDIYDTVTNTWSVSNLSEARGDIATVVVDNKLYFAGGNRGYSGSSVIDIYDGTTGTWSVSNLNSPVAGAGTVSADGKIFFAGGYDVYSGSGGAPLQNWKCDVQVRNMNDQSYSSASLISKVSSMITCKRRDNKIIFFPTGEYAYNFFDVLDITTNSWSIGMINDFLRGGICFVYRNEIYYAGGYTGSPTFGPIGVNDQILKLEF